MSTVAEPKTAAGQPLLPPEEQFWKRYSPHHEAPLSGVTSTILHLLAILLLLGIIWMQNMLKTDELYNSVPVEVVKFQLPGGGGGAKDGKGVGTGGTGDEGEQGDEAVEGPKGDPTKTPPPEHAPLEPSKAQDVLPDF